MIACGGRSDGAAFSNDEVKAAYEEHGEEIVPLGIHGTTVAVDWDACTAQGSLQKQMKD